MDAVAYEVEQVHRAEVRSLERCRIFRGLNEGDLQAIAAASVHRVYRRGHLILGPGDEPEALCAIVAGEARLYEMAPGGRREIDLAILSAGDLAGLSILSGHCRWHSCLEATVDRTEVYHIPRRLLRRLLLSYPELALHALDVAVDLLDSTRNLVADVALRDLQASLGCALVRVATMRGRDVVAATHEELARMVGSRREEVTKALSQLRRLGLVRCEYGRVYLLDPERLASLSST